MPGLPTVPTFSCLGGAVLAGGPVAAALAALQIRRLPLGEILREQ